MMSFGSFLSRSIANQNNCKTISNALLINNRLTLGLTYLSLHMDSVSCRQTLCMRSMPIIKLIKSSLFSTLSALVEFTSCSLTDDSNLSVSDKDSFMVSAVSDAVHNRLPVNKRNRMQPRKNIQMYFNIYIIQR